MTSPSVFLHRLTSINQQYGHPICIGIDPSPKEPGSFIYKEAVRTGAETFLTNYVCSIIDSTHNTAGTAKFQSAYFESFGAPGFKALEQGIKHAKQKGIFCILDAKRGDIASTMSAYGSAAFDTLGADALTVTPYMGWDVFEPLLPWLRQGKGVYAVWLTSNPAARALQSATVVHEDDSRHSLTSHIAATILGEANRCAVANAIGWVAGATKMQDLRRELQVFEDPVALLLPGVGAQGGAIDQDMRALLSKNPGSLIPISRGLTQGAEQARSWDDFGSRVAASLNQFIAQCR